LTAQRAADQLFTAPASCVQETAETSKPMHIRYWSTKIEQITGLNKANRLKQATWMHQPSSRMRGHCMNANLVSAGDTGSSRFVTPEPSTLVLLCRCLQPGSRSARLAATISGRAMAVSCSSPGEERAGGSWMGGIHEWVCRPGFYMFCQCELVKYGCIDKSEGPGPPLVANG
jgi:hypothetical protein